MRRRHAARLAALEARPASKRRDHGGRLTPAELEAELDRVYVEIDQDTARRQAKDDKLRSQIGEAAFAEVLAERHREYEAHQARVKAVVLKPEWLEWGFDSQTLPDIEAEAVLDYQLSQFVDSDNSPFFKESETC